MNKQLLGALGICTLMLCGCTGGYKNLKDLRGETVELFPLKKNGYYLYVDSEGKEVTNAKFRTAGIFHDGIALVQDTLTQFYGYINAKGEYLIEPKYKDATIFFDDIAWVVEPDSCLKAINKEGEKLFTLPQAEGVLVYTDGVASFKNGEEKWGYIDKKGTVISEPKYEELVFFQNGKASVRTENGVMVIDKKGNILIKEGEYDEIILPDEDLPFYIIKKGDKYGVIDENNKLYINPQYDYMMFDSDERYAFIVDKKGGWCDKNGKVIIKAKYKGGRLFNKNELTTYYSSNKKYGYMDKNGKTVIMAKYEEATAFNEGRACVKKDGKWGIINIKGEYIADPQFEWILPFHGKVTVAQSGGKYGLIDAEGKYVANPDYEGFSGKLMDLSGSNIYIESDYFDMTHIINAAKDWVENVNLNANLDMLMKEYNLVEKNIKKGGQVSELQNKKRLNKYTNISTAISVNKAWNKISDGWFGYTYQLNKEAIPDYYLFNIELKGKAYIKRANISEAIRTVLGMKSDTYQGQINGKSIEIMYDEKDASVIYIKVSSNVI